MAARSIELQSAAANDGDADSTDSTNKSQSNGKLKKFFTVFGKCIPPVSKPA